MKIFCIALVTFVVYGCSSTSTLTEGETIDGNVKIHFKDGRQVDASLFQMGKDTSQWTEPHTNLSHSVASADITKVVFTSHGSGALDGLWIGALTGAGAGLIVAAASNPGTDGSCGCGGMVYVVLPPGGALLGTLIGAGVGSISGHTYTYEFQPPSGNSQ